MGEEGIVFSYKRIQLISVGGKRETENNHLNTTVRIVAGRIQGHLLKLVDLFVEKEDICIDSKCFLQEMY